MRVGDLFELPENVIRQIGRRGKIKNTEETKIVGMYEVIRLGIEDNFAWKGRIIVTYGNKRTK